MEGSSTKAILPKIVDGATDKNAVDVVQDVGDVDEPLKDDFKDNIGGEPLFISSISKDEPVVTRRELWSYYLYYNGDNVRLC